MPTQLGINGCGRIEGSCSVTRLRFPMWSWYASLKSWMPVRSLSSPSTWFIMSKKRKPLVVSMARTTKQNPRTRTSRAPATGMWPEAQRCSCGHFTSRRVAVVVTLGCAPDADDPPYEAERCGVNSCCVSNAISDTGPLQYASHSWILGRVSSNCISQCTSDSLVSRSQSCGPRQVAFQQAFNSPPTCFAVSLAVAPDQFSGTRSQDSLH